MRLEICPPPAPVSYSELMIARAWSAVISGVAGAASVDESVESAGSAHAAGAPPPNIKPAASAPLANTPVAARRRPVFLLVCVVIEPPMDRVPDPDGDVPQAGA